MPAVTPEDRDRIHALHKAGLGRNAIAKETGFSAATITKVCTTAGLHFDRTATAQAVAARSIDLRARRQAIVHRLYGRAEKNLDRLEDTAGYSYRIILAGGAEMGASAEIVTDDDPPSSSEKDHAASISTYLTAAAKLEAVDTDGGASDAASMLARLGEALGVTGPA